MHHVVLQNEARRDTFLRQVNFLHRLALNHWKTISNCIIERSERNQVMGLV